MEWVKSLRQSIGPNAVSNLKSRVVGFAKLDQKYFIPVDGYVLFINIRPNRSGEVIVDRTEGKKDKIKLPDREYGSMFIFRVFNNISYGLVMQVSDSVQIGDVAKSPE